jgi:hypothetical protein
MAAIGATRDTAVNKAKKRDLGLLMSVSFKACPSLRKVTVKRRPVGFPSQVFETISETDILTTPMRRNMHPAAVLNSRKPSQ